MTKGRRRWRLGGAHETQTKNNCDDVYIFISIRSCLRNSLWLPLLQFKGPMSKLSLKQTGDNRSLNLRLKMTALKQVPHLLFLRCKPRARSYDPTTSISTDTTCLRDEASLSLPRHAGVPTVIYLPLNPSVNTARQQRQHRASAAKSRGLIMPPLPRDHWRSHWRSAEEGRKKGKWEWERFKKNKTNKQRRSSL